MSVTLLHGDVHTQYVIEISTAQGTWDHQKAHKIQLYSCYSLYEHAPLWTIVVILKHGYLQISNC